MTPVLRLIERRSREVRLPSGVVSELLVIAPPRFEVQPTPRRDVYRLTSHGLAGELRLSRCTIRIRPKLPDANLRFLLGSDSISESVSSEQEWVDPVAIRLAELIRVRLEAGLARRYVETAERQAYLRGRLDVTSQLRDLPTPRMQFFCEFDQFTEDHLFHQLPKAAALRLLNGASLSVPSRIALENAIAGLGAVSEIDPSGLESRIEPIPAGYEELTELSRWILAGLSLAPGFLLDLERLFESFLARRLRDSLSRSELIAETGHRIPLMNRNGAHPDLELLPDLVIFRGSHASSILDAKWKNLGTSPEPADVQQVISYGTAMGVNDVRLIYPGHRYACRVYDVAASGMKLSIHTIRVVGPHCRCEEDWRKFAAALGR